MPSRMRLHRAEQATWSTTYVTCFYSAPLSLLSWRRASPSQPEFVVAASVARLGRLLRCCFAVVDARGTRMAIDADARPEKHDGRVELVGRVVPVASRDEGHRPTRAHVHPGRSDGRSGCCHRATQEHEFHLESPHYEIFDLEIDLTITLLSRFDAKTLGPRGPKAEKPAPALGATDTPPQHPRPAPAGPTSGPSRPTSPKTRSCPVLRPPGHSWAE